MSRNRTNRASKFVGSMFVSSLSVIMMLICLAPRAAHAVVVQDSFNTGSTMAGRTPDTANLPGNTWVLGNGINSIASGQEVVGSDGAAAIDISSAGSYVKPTRFTISADLDLNAMTGATGEPQNPGDVGITRGITLGFFGAGDTLFNERRSPLGVTYNDFTGHLLLVVPDPSGIKVLATISQYNGTTPLPLTGIHNLSYDVNTATGNISNVMFDGFAVSFGITTTQFTDAATALAGSYAGSGAGNTFGRLDNFTITQVPEPTSIGLVTMVAASMVLRLRHIAK